MSMSTKVRHLDPSAPRFFCYNKVAPRYPFLYDPSPHSSPMLRSAPNQQDALARSGMMIPMRTTFCLLLLSLLAFGIFEGTVVAADPQSNEDEDPSRQMIRVLREKYRAAESDLDIKESIVQEAIEAGNQIPLGLRSLVRLDYDKLATDYWPRLRRQAKKMDDTSTDALLASANANLLSQRDSLLQLTGMFDRLSATTSDESPKTTLRSLFEKREQKIITATKSKGKFSIRVRGDEAEVMRLTNALRKKNGLSQLTTDPRLVATARDHSSDMKRLDFFQHESPIEGKQTPADRAVRFKTTANAENLAAGDYSPLEVIQGWLGSPGHRANLLQPEWNRIGVGRVGNYWTALYGQ